MLRTRVISAIILFGLISGPALAGGLPFLLLILLIGLLAAWEQIRLFRQSGHHPSLPLAATLTTLLILQAQWPDALPAGLVITIAVVGSLFWTLGHNRPNPATDWALALASSLYLGWLLGHFVRVRALEDGLAWLLVGAGAIWIADSSAYFAGRAFGRHPWWPRHSPEKTWEGYLAGAAGAALAAGGLSLWLLNQPIIQGAALGLLIGLLAPLGDLAESMIKRQAGAKDSSHLIPGHGGVLDRIDSLLIAIPLVYYWIVLI